MPNMKNLLYPAKVPSFEELELGGHKDPRGIIYVIARIDPQRKKPISADEIEYKDFGRKSAAVSVLRKAGLIQPLEAGEELEQRLTRDELVALLRERGMPSRGNKKVLADRLAQRGYRIDRRKHRGSMFRLTEIGTGIITVCQNDEQMAVCRAINALKELNYQGAVEAYRRYDAKWGFTHTSGKVHTIFACCDIPFDRFRLIESCQMRELKNTIDFKKTLRACLLAGLMRGKTDQWQLRCEFERVCKEKIDCPRLLSLFDYPREVLLNMKRNIEFDAGNALEYYISHLLYLSR